MDNKNIIVTENIVKRFGSITAVNQVSLSVKKGTMCALLGTNGAGKSTLIKILTTSLEPSSGSAMVAGHQIGKNDNRIRRSIGVVFQQSLLDPLLTVRENLVVRASFYQLPDVTMRIDELAQLIGLEEFIDRRYGKLSGGQRRRVDIARALIHSPALLFLDEPTTGLDPKSREDVWHTVHDLQKRKNLTVLLTTHYMEEAERANDVYMISHGKIVAHDTPQALRAAHAADILTLVPAVGTNLLAMLHKHHIDAVADKDTLLVRVSSAREALDLLKEYENHIVDFEFRHGDMDDAFLSLAEKAERLR